MERAGEALLSSWCTEETDKIRRLNRTGACRRINADKSQMKIEAPFPNAVPAITNITGSG